MNPPTLLTQRLSLKPCEVSDYDEVAAMWADEEVVRHIGGNKRSAQDAWFAQLRNRGLWPLLGYGYWIVRERRTDTFVGEVGFADFMRGIEPDISGRPEAGWVIASTAWGKGYASEAVKTAHDWLDEVMPGRSTCIIDADNSASIRVAEKVGYSEIGPTEYRGDPVLLFERYSPGTRKG
ncbi:MAG: GNAT family N-acetyltransferase [Hyphomonadaceae bacterium]|nr:GNAT family N-acetyltransferase [Hyphomonadaceae bacterium]